MRMVSCYACGKRYDYDDDGFCPKCGAFNQPARERNAAGARVAEGGGKPPAAGKKRAQELQRELGMNLKQMEKAMNQLLKSPPRGRRLPGGDR